jgi:hypothetical protein
MGITRKLEVKTPVPVDIDIANSVEPLPISVIAEELGLQSQEIEFYGNRKAKVQKKHRILIIPHPSPAVPLESAILLEECRSSVAYLCFG